MVAGHTKPPKLGPSTIHIEINGSTSYTQLSTDDGGWAHKAPQTWASEAYGPYTRELG